MSFRGRGGGGGYGGGRGGYGGGGGGGGFRRGGGRGGGRSSFGYQDMGPPEQVVELGHFEHTSQDDLVVKVSLSDVPFFNAPVYLENKEQIGKIDEIFGTLRDYFVSVKVSEGIKAKSFAKQQKLFIDPNKLLPLQRFLPQPPGSVQKRGGRGRGGGRGGGGRGGRGGGRGFGGGGGRGRGFGGGGRGGGGGYGRGGGGFGRGGGGGGYGRGGGGGGGGWGR
ncbi:probable H/ACA ribonucleoprotein complex subunit 1 [Anabrus simplex]|uniref:probable H/ACA ribonucleoprotein complex subunit 1 n=1 Tax=Anabrus simplex TaxID=316456 RepID=UPI0034DD6870